MTVRAVGPLRIALCVLCCAGQALPAPKPANEQSTPVSTRSKVILVRSAPGNADLQEAPTRIRAELEAAGFEVEIVDGDPTLDPREQLAQIERQSTRTPAPVATIVLTDAASGMAADIWIADRLTAKTTVRRIDIQQGSQAPSILAVRTVELLRASLLETQQAIVPDQPRAEPVPLDVQSWLEPPPSKQREQRKGSLDIAAIGLLSLDGIGPLVGPVLGGCWGTPALTGRLTLAAPIWGASLQRAAGSAQVQPLFLQVDAITSVALGTSSQLYGSVGFGAYGARVSGEAAPPAVGHSETRVGGMLQLGVGARFQLAQGVALLVEPQVLWFLPALAVRIANQEAGRIGHPAVTIKTGVSWAL